jgi:hypothetical protein
MSDADTIERPETKPGFQIYRNAEAKNFAEFDVMDYVGMTPELGEHLGTLVGAGFGEGQVVKLLFAAPGFSLTYAWFKSGFPLPRHTHSADCLYYIIAGSLQLGSETLGGGDGFFLPAEMAYAYTPGPQGVEVLEFRTAERFDIRFLAANPAFWARALDTVARERPGWADQPRPQDGGA